MLDVVVPCNDTVLPSIGTRGTVPAPMLNAADPTICVRAVEPRSAGDVCRVIQGEARQLVAGEAARVCRVLLPEAVHDKTLFVRKVGAAVQ